MGDRELERFEMELGLIPLGKLDSMADEGHRLAAKTTKHGRSPIGVFLAKYRLDRGTRLKDMAAVLGVTPSYLSAVEHGTKPLTGMLANALEMALEFRGTRERRGFEKACDLSTGVFTLAPVPGDPLDARLCAEFARSYRRLDTKQKKRILEILRRA